MEKEKVYNLLGVFGQMEYDQKMDMTSFKSGVEKMQELKKVLDVLGVKYLYRVSTCDVGYSTTQTQHALHVDFMHEWGVKDSVGVYAYEYHKQGE